MSTDTNTETDAPVGHAMDHRASPQAITPIEYYDADLIAMIEESRRTSRDRFIRVDLDSLR